jgi:hypothetical protein
VIIALAKSFSFKLRDRHLVLQYILDCGDSTMAGIVSEALAGMAEEQAAHHVFEDVDKLQERHRAIIRDHVLPRMTKIQREMKGRRYRVSTTSTNFYVMEALGCSHFYCCKGGASETGG